MTPAPAPAPAPDYRLPGTYGATDTAYLAVETLAPLDGETAGQLYRLIVACQQFGDRIVAAREAAGHGNGQTDNGHIITRNRLGRTPARYNEDRPRDGTTDYSTADYDLTDPDYTALRRALGSARRRIRTLADDLEAQLATMDPTHAADLADSQAQ